MDLVRQPAVHPASPVRAGRIHAAVLATAKRGLANGAKAGPTAGGPAIGRRAAQQLAHRELSRSIYQPGIWQRILGWLSRLLAGAGGAIPGGWFGLVVLAVLAVLVISGLVLWVRPARWRRTAGHGALPDKVLSAQGHRANAERLAAANDYSGAIIERVRAIAAELEERGVVPARPGRTADELAAEAGHELPAQSRGLRQAMRLFDDVRYGDRVGTETGYQQVSQVDDDLRSARGMASSSPQPAFSGFGVPR
jgi:hypothetical protein